jgi:hypothetical protein
MRSAAAAHGTRVARNNFDTARYLRSSFEPLVVAAGSYSSPKDQGVCELPYPKSKTIANKITE